MARLEKQPHVVAAAPIIYAQVLISIGGRARGAVLKGIVPQEERKVSDLLNSVKQGSADELDEQRTESSSDQNTQTKKSTGEGARATQDNPDLLENVQQRRAAMPPILLGKDMADELGAKVGSVVLVTSPQGELTPFGMVPKYSRFRVAGIFDSGFYDYDSSWSFVRLSDAQRLFALGATKVTVYSNVVTVEALAGAWDALAPKIAFTIEHLFEFYGDDAGWSFAARGMEAPVSKVE